MRRLSPREVIPVTRFDLPRGFATLTGFYMVDVEFPTMMMTEDTTLFEVNTHAKPIQPPPICRARHQTTMREVWEGKLGEESFLNAGGCRYYRQHILKKGHRYQTQSQSQSRGTFTPALPNALLMRHAKDIVLCDHQGKPCIRKTRQRI